jgi:hypothetical protein
LFHLSLNRFFTNYRITDTNNFYYRMARRNPARLTSLEQRLNSLHKFIQNNAYIFSRRKGSKRAYTILPCPRFCPCQKADKTIEAKETTETTQERDKNCDKARSVSVCAACGSFGSTTYSGSPSRAFNNILATYPSCSSCMLEAGQERTPSFNWDFAATASQASTRLSTLLHVPTSSTKQQRGTFGAQMEHAGEI